MLKRFLAAVQIVGHIEYESTILDNVLHEEELESIPLLREQKKKKKKKGCSAQLATSPSDRAVYLRAVASALDAARLDLVPVAAEETHPAEGAAECRADQNGFQFELYAREIEAGYHFGAVIDHADPTGRWGRGRTSGARLRRSVRCSSTARATSHSRSGSRVAIRRQRWRPDARWSSKGHSYHLRASGATAPG